MSFTRFHDDKARINKQLQEMTWSGRYMLNVPGNGTTPNYVSDPHLRLQKWGGNLMTNSILLENDLRGMNRPLTRDASIYNYKEGIKNISSSKPYYPEGKEYTDESRTVAPAWELRDKEHERWTPLLFDPQQNIWYNFQNNLGTRMLEKDYYIKNQCNNQDDFKLPTKITTDF
jgi:hypothetical protein